MQTNAYAAAREQRQSSVGQKTPSPAKVPTTIDPQPLTIPDSPFIALQRQRFRNLFQTTSQRKPDRKLGVSVNDDRALEHEADVMGARSSALGAQGSSDTASGKLLPTATSSRTVQRTAWEKMDAGWERRVELGRFERDSAGETTPPPTSIGKRGWFYSSNTMSFYKDEGAYAAALRPELALTLPDPSDKSPSAEGKRDEFNRRYQEPRSAGSRAIMVTELDGEDKLQGKRPGSVEFHEDLTHNYLLWSVPKYTGQNLMAKVKTQDLKVVSGEAAAEWAADDGQGYMMKQTQEHLEALTALIMIQGDENLQPGGIAAQYGSAVGPFDPAKADPLHNPRDPETQNVFIKILTSCEGVYEDAATAGAEIAKTGKLIVDEAKDSGLATAIADLLKASPTLKDFNDQFHRRGLAEALLTAVTAANPAFGEQDRAEEVTRAALKDPKDRSLTAIGGRQAIFDSIWGPKSKDVVTKAAERNDSVRSHGLDYHRNPKKTVQAQYEFPPYLKLVREKLGPVLEARGDAAILQRFQYDVIKALEAIIINIKAMGEQKGEVDKLPEVREAQLKAIKERNKALELAMKDIRAFLAT